MFLFALNFHLQCVMIAAAPTIAGPILAGVVIEDGEPIRRGRSGLCRASSFFTRVAAPAASPDVFCAVIAVEVGCELLTLSRGGRIVVPAVFLFWEAKREAL